MLLIDFKYEDAPLHVCLQLCTCVLRTKKLIKKEKSVKEILLETTVCLKHRSSSTEAKAFKRGCDADGGCELMTLGFFSYLCTL